MSPEVLKATFLKSQAQDKYISITDYEESEPRYP